MNRDLALAAPAELHELLASIGSMLDGSDHPVQFCHLPADWPLPSRQPGAAAQLTARLARQARVSTTSVHGLGHAARPTSLLDHDFRLRPRTLPRAVGEDRDGVDLPDGRAGHVLTLSRWPAVAELDWLHDVAQLADAVTIHARPIDTPTAERLLRRRLSTLLSTSVVDEQAGHVSDASLAAAVDGAEQLRHAVARGSTRLWAAQVLVAIVTSDPDARAERVEALRSAVAAHRAVLRRARFEHAPGWAALRAGGHPMPGFWRLLDTASLAATIPHPTIPRPPEAEARTLVLAGADTRTGAPLLRDRFAGHNGNRLVVGTSGAGKSYAAKVELLRHLVRGTHATVIDPEGEFTQLTNFVGGLALTVGEEPAGLDPVALACRPGVTPAEGFAVLASFASALLVEPLTSVDLAVLDRAVGVLRADRGSTPTVADLIAVISELAAYPPFTGNDLAGRLTPAAAGTLAELFAPNPDLLDPPPLVSFDLRSVPARARPAVMACVLAFAWNRTQHAVAHPRLVVVDEAHLLLDDPPAAELLAQFARRARKYGVALELITQRMSDFLGHPTGEAVIANMATKLLLGCEDHERAAIAGALNLSAAEAAVLRPGTRGRGLLLAADLRTVVDVVAHDAEHELAATGPRTDA